MLAPRAVKRKACPPVSTSPASRAGPAEKTARDSADGATDSFFTQDQFMPAAGAGSVAQGDVRSEPLQDSQDAIDTHNTSDDTEEQNRARNQQEILVAVEEAVSDWGLSLQNQELLSKLESSADGYVHVSNLLLVRTIAAVADSIADITAALKAVPSVKVELDDSSFRIRPTRLPSLGLSDMTVTEWGQRTFYIENIPLPGKAKLPSRTSLVALLESLFECAVEVLRLPELYVPAPGTSQHAGSTTSRKPDRKGKQRQAISDEENEYSLPEDGGPYKGFAFVVLADAAKAETAQRRWDWTSRGVAPADGLDRSETASCMDEEADSSGSEDEDSRSDDALNGNVAGLAEASTSDPPTQQPRTPEAATALSGALPASAQTAHDGNLNVDGQSHAALDARKALQSSKEAVSPRELADACGLRMMPISIFNGLKYEYLSYSRDLLFLQEKQEEADLTSRVNTRRGRSRSPDGNASHLKSGFARGGRSERDSHAAKRKRSPSPGKWERKARSPSPARWVRKALSPSPERAPRRYDANDVDYPRGCVVFLKRFNAAASTRTLKALLQAVLESEEVDVEKLQYVDHVRSVDSCHLRFSDAATASFLASYFSGTGAKKLLHTDADSVDPREAFTKASPEEARAVEAEVISGTPEIIYWSKVPLKARQAYSTNGTAAREDPSASAKVAMEVDDDEEAYHRSMAARRKAPAA